MAWYRAGGGGIPASVKTDMNNVLNKKMGTSGQTYQPSEWADEVNLMGMLEEKTASGAIASFEDGADDVPISSGLFSFTPKQSGTGTPSPSNPRAISGYTGMTIIKSNALAQYIRGLLLGTYDFIDMGDLTWGIAQIGTTGIYRVTTSTISTDIDKPSANSAPFDGVCSCYDVLSANSTYNKNKGISSNTNGIVYVYDDDYNTSSSASAFASAVDGEYLIYKLAIPKTPTITMAQLETIASAFGISLTHIVDSFGTTVYGGSRATDGTLTDGCKKIKLSDLSWTYQSANTSFYSNTIQNLVKRPASNNDVAENFVCECFDATKASDILNVVGDNNIGIAVSGTVFLRCTTYTDKDDLISALGNYYLTYPLATPTPTTLSVVNINTYYGANNIYTDMETGNSKVTYRSSGTVTPIVPVLTTKSITENDTYNASDDNADGYSSVTVNVPTAPSGMVVMDFTSISLPFTLNGVSYGSTGAVFDNTSDYIDLPFFHAGMEIEIDVASISLGQNANRRFFSSYRNQGFLYRNSNVWSFYNGSWYDTSISDSGYFDNSTVKIVVDSNNYWHIYKDDVLIFEPAGACAISEPAIGSKDGSCINNATITGVRMKEVTT